MAEESKNGKAAAPALKLDVEVYNAGAIVERHPTRSISEQQLADFQALAAKLPKGGELDSTLFRVTSAGGTVVWEEWRQCGSAVRVTL